VGEEVIGTDEAAVIRTVAVEPGARAVVAVAAQVRRDEGEAWGARRLGEVDARCPRARRAVGAEVPRGTTLALHSAAWSMIEWKYTKGLCRVVYWSLAVATSAVSGAPTLGWAQSVPPLGSGVPPSRVGRCPCPGRTHATRPRGSSGSAGTWRRAGWRWWPPGGVDAARAVDLAWVCRLVGIGVPGDVGVDEAVHRAVSLVVRWGLA